MATRGMVGLAVGLGILVVVGAGSKVQAAETQTAALLIRPITGTVSMIDTVLHSVVGGMNEAHAAGLQEYNDNAGSRDAEQSLNGAPQTDWDSGVFSAD